MTTESLRFGAAGTDPPWEEVHGRTLRTLAATTAVGLAAGLVIGGIGSRLAMRALFLTSHPSVRGMITDDRFVIGQFDPGATLGLLLAATMIGVVGAFVYLAVRPFLLGPRWLRRATCALAAGAVVGSLIVHTDGVDFIVLTPRWFAVALFVAIPTLFGLVVPPAVDRAQRPGGWFQSAPAPVALLPLLALLAPPLVVVVVVPVVVILGAGHLVHRSARLSRLVRSAAALWAVRAGFGGVALLGAVALVKDVTELL